MFVSAIVLAAGQGLRFSRHNSFTARGGTPTYISKMIKSGKSSISKLLVEINSTPIIIRCLKVISKVPSVKEIIVVVNNKNSKKIVSEIKRHNIGKVKSVVRGGLRRQDSVYNGLRAINKQADFVLIHDAARPLIDGGLVLAVITEAKKSGAAIAAVPVKATIKKVKSQKPPPQKVADSPMAMAKKVKSLFVENTINRENLWEVQTPQVFRKGLIFEAYRKFNNIEATDDAMLVERLRAKVSIVPGSYNNIKITTPEDLVIAEAILKSRRKASATKSGGFAKGYGEKSKK